MTVTGLSRTALGQRVPLAVDRAISPLRRLSGREKLVGWLGPIALTLLAFGLRLVGLGAVDVVARTRRWLEEHPDAAPALRRLVVESMDTARRAEAAQSVDC